MAHTFWIYSLTIILLHQCQDKRYCDVVASTKTFKEDPCPGTSKYLEVAYKCKPTDFRSRTSCEGEQMTIKCARPKRIAVYSAMFGRSPKINARCLADPATETDCQAECALQVVMRLCHGHRRCSLSSTEQTFGNPCDADTPKYLHVVYTCVPKRILREMKHGDDYPYSFCPTGPGDNATWLEPSVPTSSSSPISPYSKANDILSNEDFLPATTPNVTFDIAAVQQRKLGLINDWMFTFQHVKENREKVLLYLILGVCCGTIFVLLAIILKLSMWNKRRRKHQRAKMEISHPIRSPNENQSLLDMTDKTDGIEMLSYRPTPFSCPTPHMRSDTSSTTSPHSTLSRPPPHMRNDPFAQRGAFDRSPSPTNPRHDSGSSSQNSPPSPLPVVRAGLQPHSTFGPSYGSASDIGVPRSQRQNSYPGTGPEPSVTRDSYGTVPRNQTGQMAPILRNTRQRTFGQPQQPPPPQPLMQQPPGPTRALRSASLNEPPPSPQGQPWIRRSASPYESASQQGPSRTLRSPSPYEPQGPPKILRSPSPYEPASSQQGPPLVQGPPRTLRSGSLPRSPANPPGDQPQTLRSESPQGPMPRSSMMTSPDRSPTRPGNNHITFAQPRHPSEPFSPVLPPAGYSSALKPDSNHGHMYGQPVHRNNNGSSSMTMGPNTGLSLPPPHLCGDARSQTLGYR